MSSFFSRFRSSKKKTGNGVGAQGNVYRSGASSQNSSATSLPTRGQADVGRLNSQQQAHRSQQQQQQQLQQQQLHSGSGVASYQGIGKQSQSQQQLQRQNTTHTVHLPSAQSQTSLATPQPTPLFLQNPLVRAALVKGSFQTIVELPKYVDLNEWLALNVFEFNSYLNLVLSMLDEFIDTQSPMTAGPGFEYLWIDGNQQPMRLPASTYIDQTMKWIGSKFDDQSIFPTRQGVPFGPNFQSIVKSIYLQQFRIFAYIYHTHFDKLVHLSLEPHWNSLFCHFASFGRTFGLLDQNEITPLAALIQNFEAQGKIKM